MSDFTLRTFDAWAKGLEPGNRWTAGHKGMIFENKLIDLARVVDEGYFENCYPDGSPNGLGAIVCGDYLWRVWSEPEPPEPAIIEVTIKDVVCEAWPISVRDGHLTYDCPGEVEDDWEYLDYVIRDPRWVGFAFKREGKGITPDRDVLGCSGGFRNEAGYLVSDCRSGAESVPPTHVIMRKEVRT